MEAEQGYFEAWKQVADRIRQGSSLSGRERNCCFMNTRGPRFADVSFVTGLDHIDDGRAIAICDWDHDGDLDLWLSNRTGPRIRFLRNDLPTDNDFVAVRLIGDPNRQCNRDAVGARVELHLYHPDGSSTQQIQTLYAGDGFLSQSSKWIHFGIQAGTNIQQIIVRWPNGRDVETFTGLSANRRYRILQGTRRAETVDQRGSLASLVVANTEVPESSDQARLRFSLPVEIAPLEYHDLDGNVVKLEPPYEADTLLTLWASWCKPCVDELRDLAAHENQLNAAGVKIIALNVEGIESDPLKPGRAKELLTELGFNHSAGIADSVLVRNLDSLLSDAYYGHRRLPLPTSFLIDRHGRLTVVYKGPLDVAKLITDVSHMQADDTESLALALPFEGRWSNHVFVDRPTERAYYYLEEGNLEQAGQLLEEFLANNPPPPADSQTLPSRFARKNLADVLHLLGRISVSQGKTKRASAFYRTALSFNPDNVPTLVDFASFLITRDNYREATRHLEHALELRGDDPVLHSKLGVLRQREGQIQVAISLFQKALQLDENCYSAANNLAWLRATHPDADIRDGSQAVRLSERVVKSVGRSRLDVLDTLAAAYAETGNFDSAMQFAEQALRLAEKTGKQSLATQIAQRLELYRQGRAFREEPENSGVRE